MRAALKVKASVIICFTSSGRAARYITLSILVFYPSRFSSGKQKLQGLQFLLLLVLSNVSSFEIEVMSDGELD